MYLRSIRLLAVAALVGVGLTACGDDDQKADRTTDPPGVQRSEPAPRPGDVRTPGNDARPAEARQPDNTAQNKGDGGAEAKTPFDQSEDPADIRITADIRKGILGMDKMSTNADNVKIMTSAGVVSLRGVVESQSEKDAIGNIATGLAGVTRVDNQLMVDPN